MADRSAALIARFARLIADGMASLGYPADAHGWYNLAASGALPATGSGQAETSLDRTDAMVAANHAAPDVAKHFFHNGDG